MVDLNQLEALLASIDEKTEGSSLERIANGSRVAFACVDYLRENGYALIARIRDLERIEAGVRGSASSYVNRVYDCELGADMGEIPHSLPPELIGKTVYLVPVSALLPAPPADGEK